MDKMEEYSKKLAFSMNIRGLLNIQFAIKDEKVYVIEANPRASRTVPFICKAYQVPYINIATKIMLGTHKLKDFTIERKLEGLAIKFYIDISFFQHAPYFYRIKNVKRLFDFFDHHFKFNYFPVCYTVTVTVASFISSHHAGQECSQVTQ